MNKDASVLEKWDESVEVLVLGAGAGGMASAIVSANEGLNTLVIEKTDHVGGTAARSVGAIWLIDTLTMREAGFADSDDMARRYFAQTVSNSVPNELMEAYITRGREALAYLLANSELEVAAVPYPDYLPHIDGGVTGGRFHAPVEYDGKLLGARFDEVRSPLPIFTALGGMMLDDQDLAHFLEFPRSLRSVRHVAKRVARQARDRLSYKRGTRLVLGNALIARLFKTLIDRRVPIWRNTTVVRLVKDGDRVVGAEVDRGGRLCRVRARAGVVIATGGFPGNLQMREEHSRKPTESLTIALESNVGEGIRLAQSVGGQIDRNSEDTAYYVPMSVVREKGKAPILWPHFVIDRAKPGIIAVDANGRRFTDESANYHDFVKGMYAAKVQRAYLIADATAMERYGLGIVRAKQRRLRALKAAGYLYEAESLNDLAAKIGVNPAGLVNSVDKNNQYASTGRDPDFHRGENAYEQFQGDPKRFPNPCLGSIERAPFYAVEIQPGDFGTSRGLKTDANAQVLDESNRPIKGLFACGNDMNSPVGGQYLGGGITLGPALTFGYIAARAIAQQAHIAQNSAPALKQSERSLSET